MLKITAILLSEEGIVKNVHLKFLSHPHLHMHSNTLPSRHLPYGLPFTVEKKELSDMALHQPASESS